MQQNCTDKKLNTKMIVTYILQKESMVAPVCWNKFVVTKYGSRSKERKFLIPLVWLSAENLKVFFHLDSLMSKASVSKSNYITSADDIMCEGWKEWEYTLVLLFFSIKLTWIDKSVGWFNFIHFFMDYTHVACIMCSRAWGQ